MTTGEGGTGKVKLTGTHLGPIPLQSLERFTKVERPFRPFGDRITDSVRCIVLIVHVYLLELVQWTRKIWSQRSRQFTSIITVGGVSIIIYFITTVNKWSHGSCNILNTQLITITLITVIIIRASEKSPVPRFLRIQLFLFSPVDVSPQGKVFRGRPLTGQDRVVVKGTVQL